MALHRNFIFYVYIQGSLYYAFVYSAYPLTKTYDKELYDKPAQVAKMLIPSCLSDTMTLMLQKRNCVKKSF